MSLSILNNVAALYAQNNINSTQSSLQKTLQQLSSGSRINSGADDPSGLAVSDGLNANEAALTQSSTNATEGIGLLQTADGALSQVTSLLDQAVSIATEASNGTLTSAQVSSANQEYQNILTQINDIGSTTNFNSIKVFDNNAKTMVVSDGTTAGTASYAETIGGLTSSTVGTGAVALASSAATVAHATDTATVSGAAATSVLNGSVTITGGTGGSYTANFDGGNIATELAEFQTGGSQYAAVTAAGLTASASSTTGITFTSTTTTDTLATTNNATTSTAAQVAAAAGVGTGVSLAGALTAANAAATLDTITTAVNDVAYQRGTLGGEINQLSSAASVTSAEQVNLSSAQNSVTATDYGQAASNLSKYQILSQTGISALAQANSVQQEVLKLLQ